MILKTTLMLIEVVISGTRLFKVFSSSLYGEVTATGLEPRST